MPEAISYEADSLLTATRDGFYSPATLRSFLHAADLLSLTARALHSQLLTSSPAESAQTNSSSAGLASSQPP